MPISFPDPLEEIIPGIPVGLLDAVVPAGIECPLEYNGLIMNRRSQPEHIRIISIDGLDGADIRATVDNNPSDHGEFIIDSPLYGGRTMVLNGKIMAQSLPTMRAMKQAIRNAFNTLSDYPLVFKTLDISTDHKIYTRLSAPITGLEDQGTNTQFTRDFQITLRAGNPRFLSYLPNNVTQNLSASNEINIVNLGNFPATCLVQINGSAPDTSFTNLSTGKRIHTSGVVDEGESIIFDMHKLGIRVKDSVDNNLYDRLKNDSERITLYPGSNVLKMDSPADQFGDDAFINVSYHHSWI